jgi:hypothetical protein
MKAGTITTSQADALAGRVQNALQVLRLASYAMIARTALERVDTALLAHPEAAKAASNLGYTHDWDDAESEVGYVLRNIAAEMSEIDAEIQALVYPKT